MAIERNNLSSGRSQLAVLRTISPNARSNVSFRDAFSSCSWRYPRFPTNPVPPWRPSMRTFASATLMCVVWASSLSAAQLTSLFQTTSHDFGTVARAAKTEFRFYFDNPYSQPVHVRSVRTSCGCTTPLIETETVPPGGRGSILARFNTGTHSGARGATVTVTFDKPSFTEVQLQVKGYIRTDVVFNPGEASFGNVMQGQSKSIDVAVDYAGKSNWSIHEVSSSYPFFKAEATEASRQNGRIKYNLSIAIAPNAPSGPIEGELIVRTNDRNMTSIPIRVLANVVPGISISPTNLSLGDVFAGREIKQVVILKGQQPFKVTGVTSELFDIQSNLSDESKTLHTIPIVLAPRAGAYGQEITGKIIFSTTLAERPTIEIGSVFRLKSEEPQLAPISAPPSDEASDGSAKYTDRYDDDFQRFHSFDD